MTFISSFRAELLKVKRTSVIYLILIAAMVVPFVLVFDHDSPDSTDAAMQWSDYYRQGFMVFAFLFLPFFYMFSSTLLMQIETRNNAWKQVLASPQSYFHILIAKFLVLQLLAIVFLIVFNMYMALGCALIDSLFGLNYLSYLSQWPEMLKLNAMAFGSTFGISSLSFWLALRFKNFIAPIAIGFLLWMIGPTAALELKWPLFDKYVYVLPFTIASKDFEGNRMIYQWLSLGYGLLFFGIAYAEFVLQRTQLRAGAKNDKPGNEKRIL